ncbi:MAG: DUF2975 domain-containing protein [Chitinophagaceae bacterium]|jgi:hypothetical protein|nr:DUF2975 domain-containing protein [Chitinophagaceae bacterium]
METRPKLIDGFLKVMAWVVFVGLCIQAGALLFNFVYSAFRPIAAANLYNGLNLSSLLATDPGHYWAVASLVVGVLVAKAFVFYLVIAALTEVDASRPFSQPVAMRISQIGYNALAAALLGFVGARYCQHLQKRGLDLDTVGQFWDDTKALLLMAAVVFVIARIFQKGLALQTENDLTV